MGARTHLCCLIVTAVRFVPVTDVGLCQASTSATEGQQWMPTPCASRSTNERNKRTLRCGHPKIPTKTRTGTLITTKFQTTVTNGSAFAVSTHPNPLPLVEVTPTRFTHSVRWGTRNGIARQVPKLRGEATRHMGSTLTDPRANTRHGIDRTGKDVSRFVHDHSAGSHQGYDSNKSKLSSFSLRHVVGDTGGFICIWPVQKMVG